jgi:hypothetical protein
MLRIDLEAAGIPYSVEGPDGPLFADFHALRHTYLTLGGKAGIDLRTLQELAGHSTPTLTARYSHRRLHDLAGAVEKLPSILPTAPSPDALRATGTEGTAPAISPKADPQISCAYTALTKTSGDEGGRMGAVDGENSTTPPSYPFPNPLSRKGFEGERGPSMADEGGTGARANSAVTRSFKVEIVGSNPIEDTALVRLSLPAPRAVSGSSP